MNVKEYIASGIVESYVLGLADSDERAEFERMCAAHSEVRVARDAFEASLEKYALADATPPPASLKSKIFAEIEIESEQRKTNGLSAVYPGASPAEAPVRRMSWLKLVAAASVILLVASTALNFYFFRQYKEFSGKYEDLVTANQELAKSNNSMQTTLNDYESSMSMMKDTNMAVIKMPAVPTSPDLSSIATVYWNRRSKDVYLLVNNLQKPVAGKQYQLWAMVDGVPVDAGVFDINDKDALVKMKNIPRAQAFAITLEKQGGSPTPDLTQLFVFGKV